MIENIIYALPEILLLCGILFLPVCHLFHVQHRKILKYCILLIFLSAFMDIIFYNKSFAEHYLNNTAFNTMINLIVYFCALAVLFLAKRWYVSTNESPFIYCESVLLTLLLSNIISASTHFAVTLTAYWGMALVYFLLLMHSHKLKDNYNGIKNYKRSAIFFSIVMLLIAFVFYFENGHLSYSSLSSFIAMNSNSIEVLCFIFAVFICFMFIIGLAPFNFWRTETLGQVTLPLLAYFLLIPVSACFVALLNICLNAFSSQFTTISNLFICFGAISTLIGAFGTCTGKNIYKSLSYGSLFHFGILMFALSTLDIKSINNFLLYLVTYLIAMYGLVSSFFGLKSRGEYLFTLQNIVGAADKKPFISAMITICIFSLIGFPPFFGFTGLYAVGHELAQNNHLYILVFLLIMLVIITYGYMQIIKNLYFEKSKNIFDATENSVYTIILINASITAILSLNPNIIIENIRLITENILG